LGLGRWSVDDVAAYLKTGHNRITASTGPMAEAVNLSTSQMTDGDVRALATYLKSVDHFRQETKKAGAEVVLQNHPLMLPFRDMLDKLKARKKGNPNPFVVGKASYQKFVDVMYACSDVNVARRKSS
jgi:hypothetical protein